MFLLTAAASYRWFHRAVFLYVICFAVAVVLLTVGEEMQPEHTALRIRIDEFLYAMYLNHYLIIQIVWKISPEYQKELIPVYLLILTLYSFFTSNVIRILLKLFRSGKRISAEERGTS